MKNSTISWRLKRSTEKRRVESKWNISIFLDSTTRQLVSIDADLIYQCSTYFMYKIECMRMNVMYKIECMRENILLRTFLILDFTRRHIFPTYQPSSIIWLHLYWDISNYLLPSLWYLYCNSNSSSAINGATYIQFWTSIILVIIFKIRYNGNLITFVYKLFHFTINYHNELTFYLYCLTLS